MRKLFWFVIVLAVLAVVADRGGDYAAEQVVASQLQTTQLLDTKPDVAINGIPFLTQFASSTYPDVVVTVHDIKVKDTGLKIAKVRLTFKDVTANRDFTRFNAQRGTAIATVGYATLRQSLDTDVTYAGAGRVRVSRTVTVLGKKIPVQITAQPKIVDGVLTLASPELGNKLPDGVSLDLDRAVRLRIPVRGLPFKLRVTGVSATAAGVELGLSGTSLTYSR